MLAQILDSWTLFTSMLQGIISVLSLFFTMPLLPFTVLGLIGCCVKRQAFR